MLRSQLLDGVLSSAQSERKFLLDSNTAHSFWDLASTRLQPAHRDPARPVAYHRTTYLDTANFAYYRSCHGPLSRHLRVREYATATTAEDIPVLSGSCFLELKQSSGGRRAKLRLSLAPDEIALHMARLSDADITPCLMTWYRRAALSDGSDRLRVTLDDGISFCEPRPLGPSSDAVEPLQVFARISPMVLEVKLWSDPPAWLARAMNGFCEAFGFSKFAAGMRAAEERGLIPCPGPLLRSVPPAP